MAASIHIKGTHDGEFHRHDHFFDQAVGAADLPVTETVDHGGIHAVDTTINAGERRLLTLLNHPVLPLAARHLFELGWGHLKLTPQIRVIDIEG